LGEVGWRPLVVGGRSSDQSICCGISELWKNLYDWFVAEIERKPNCAVENVLVGTNK